MANNYYFKVNKGISLTPQTTIPTNAKKGDLYFDDSLNLLQAYNGTAWNNVGGGGIESVNYYDPNPYTSLPSLSSYAPDGATTIQTGDKVLFSGLSGGIAGDDNKIQIATVSGGSVSWTIYLPFVPNEGVLVSIENGDAYGAQVIKFDGTSWDVLVTLTDSQTLTNKTIEQSPSIQSFGSISSTSIFPTNTPSATYSGSSISTSDISTYGIENDISGNTYNAQLSTLQTNVLQFYTSGGSSIESYESFFQNGVVVIEPDSLTINGEDITINAKTNLNEPPAAAGSVFINTSMASLTSGYDTGSINLTTGNTDDGDSGNIVLQTGTTVSGTRGSIQLNASSVSVSSKITNVTNPTAPQDAATKSYVDSLKWSISNSTALDVGNTINISLTAPLQTFRVASLGGNATLSSTPFGTSAPNDATCIRLIGTSDLNFISLVYNDAAKGCLLNGDCVLVKGSVIEFMYSSTDDRYYEVSRNF